ncbi:uncharacterized protein LOC108154551 isoform X1 [Drosophila miranda]|uniref:uncharacterized protein LOC108154551 isoform X1 n=1 Tax=Drosophila miranda TaxID=7229 RepID=UPI00143F3BB9|nr:uncharacterized protein LOC108154551 isoform X1 [Drosophila miranda]
MHPIIFLILATTIVVTTHTLTPNRTDYLETMECGDCEKVNQECKIVSSGYYCREHDDSDKLDARQEVEAELLHLRNCMGPDHFFFIEEGISAACCFWTQEMGCQQVKNKMRTKPCSDCATYHERGSFLDLNPMGCPCGPQGKNGAENPLECIVFIIILFMMCTILYGNI